MKKNLLNLSTVLSLILFAGCGSTNTQTKAPENINDVVNTAPIATFDKFTINRNVTYDGQLTATDADGDTLNYIIVTAPVHGTVVLHDNGCFTYTPDAGHQGNDTFSYKASDDVSSCAGKTYNFEVKAKNQAGVSTPTSAQGTTKDITTPPNAPTELKAVAINKTSLRLEWKDNADNESAYKIYQDGVKIKTISAGCHCAVVNNLKSCERYNFRVKALNKIGSSSSNTISVDMIFEVVEPTNHAPTPTFTSLNTDEDITYNGTLTATDPESDVLIFTKVSNPHHGTVSIDANGNFTYVPAANYNGVDSFSYSVSDGVNAPVTQIVIIMITDVPEPNNAPTPTFTTFTMDEDTTYHGTLTATDSESDALTFVKVVDPSEGTVTVDANGNFTYIPTADYSGDDSFSYSVSDANNAPVVQTVSITINDVAEPDTTPPVITLNGDATITLSVGDSYTELGATAHDDRDGAVSVVISGTVDTTTAGSYTVTYRAEDSVGNSSEVSREVVVEASTLPTITIGADTTVEDIVVAEYDSDDSIDITYTNI